MSAVFSALAVAFQLASRLSASASRLPPRRRHRAGRGHGARDRYRLIDTAAAYAAQVMIRWHLQEGRSAIPKSVRPERIAENFDVFGFELTTAELKALDALDTGVRGGPEPDDITLEAYGRPIPEA